MSIDVAAVRADTPGCEKVLHFNNAGASLPRNAVLERVKAHLPTIRFAMVCVSILSLSGIARTASAQTGYTGADLQRMGQWLAFHHLELHRLEMPNSALPYAAALTSGKHGWRIVVFLRDGGVTNVDWDSGFLKRPFQAANTDNFVLTPRVGQNFGIAFSGCDERNCASAYGALLYLPWSHQFFEKDAAGAAVACSQALLDPRNEAALGAIDAALARQQAAVAHYVPPKCPGTPATTK